MIDLKKHMAEVGKRITWHTCELCNEKFSKPGWHCTRCGNHEPSYHIRCDRCGGDRAGMPRIVLERQNNPEKKIRFKNGSEIQIMDTGKTEAVGAKPEQYQDEIPF